MPPQDERTQRIARVWSLVVELGSITTPDGEPLERWLASRFKERPARVVYDKYTEAITHLCLHGRIDVVWAGEAIVGVQRRVQRTDSRADSAVVTQLQAANHELQRQLAEALADVEAAMQLAEETAADRAAAPDRQVALEVVGLKRTLADLRAEIEAAVSKTAGAQSRAARLQRELDEALQEISRLRTLAAEGSARKAVRDVERLDTALAQLADKLEEQRLVLDTQLRLPCGCLAVSVDPSSCDSSHDDELTVRADVGFRYQDAGAEAARAIARAKRSVRLS